MTLNSRDTKINTKSIPSRVCEIPELVSGKTETRIHVMSFVSKSSSVPCCLSLGDNWQRLKWFWLFWMNSNSDGISCLDLCIFPPFLPSRLHAFIILFEGKRSGWLNPFNVSWSPSSVFYFSLLLKGKKTSGEWERCQVLRLFIHVFVRL